MKEYIIFENYNIMVMQLLGLSLESNLNKLPSKKMSLKTVSMLGIQMIKILKDIHDQNYIHRDIKPDNFAMGINEESNKLYIIDFGLSKLYRDPITLIQNPLIKKNKLTGTARYASIHALEGYEQSRRDDLESVGYLIIYLLKGKLPWQGLLVKNKSEKYNQILLKKKLISNDDLSIDLPYQINHFLYYVKNLGYEEEPNYNYLVELFMEILNNLNEKFDRIYDWNLNQTSVFSKNGKINSIRSRKSSFTPFEHKRKNTLNNNLFCDYSFFSNYKTKQNETLSNLLHFSSFQDYLIKSKHEEDVKSILSENKEKDKLYDNKYISQVSKNKTSSYLYKTNVNNNYNNNKCITQCCSIM